MDNVVAKRLLDNIVGNIFGYQNPLSLEQAMTKFAFDVRLPQQVYDEIDKQPSWAASMGQQRYITRKNVEKRLSVNEGMQAKQDLSTIEHILTAWNKINLSMSERQMASKNVAESDGIYSSEGVYRSINIRKSKNILFSDGLESCQSVVAGQTSKSCKDSIRVEDSKHVENSFSVIWSNKITSSMFIQDCYDLYECLFCTHLASRKFCVANIQLEESEYRRVKDLVARWVLSS